MRHFVTEILPYQDDIDLHEEINKVNSALYGGVHPEIHKRRKVSDEEILSLIAKHQNICGLIPTRLLRILRDKEGVACEQGRLRMLVESVKRGGNR
jgi:hypothetical protein